MSQTTNYGLPLIEEADIPAKSGREWVLDVNGNAASSGFVKTDAAIKAVDNKVNTISNKIGAANGIAQLNANGLVPNAQLPADDDYAFSLDENGHLIVTSANEETANEFSIDSNGHLIHTIGGTSVDLGEVKGSVVDISTYQQIVSTDTEVTLEMVANKEYRYGEITSLTITFGSATIGYSAEYRIVFKTGSTAPTVALPTSVEWAPATPSFEANYWYELSIVPIGDKYLGTVSGVTV